MKTNKANVYIDNSIVYDDSNQLDVVNENKSL